MHCPYCPSTDTRVSDTRVINEGRCIKRRRECPNCLKRFTTFERVEEVPLLVVKKDGRREEFNTSKLQSGIIKAFEKRPVPMDELLNLSAKIEFQIRQIYEREVSSENIGECVMSHLKDIDQIAYVRFASVYRQFADIANFMQEIQKLTGKIHNENNKE